MPKQNIGLKALLLRPTITAIPITLFGTPVHIRRLTAQELMDHNAGLSAASESNDHAQSALLGANLVLMALVDEKGQPIPAVELPTAGELLAAHDNVVLLDAINAVQRHSYGTYEDAKKN